MKTFRFKVNYGSGLIYLDIQSKSCYAGKRVVSKRYGVPLKHIQYLRGNYV